MQYVSNCNYNKFIKNSKSAKNYNKQKQLLSAIKNKQGFLIAFRVWGNPAEIFDSFLPLPNVIKTFENNYLVAWLIEGYFLTKNNRKFLDDVIAKLIDTILKQGALRVEWIGWINFAKLNNNDILHLNAYNLREDIAPYTESFKSKRKEYKALELLASHTQYKESDESDDAFFDWLRFKVYDFVNENGKNALTLDYVKELAIIGYEIMGHKKGLSTPLAKAKAIYNWVMENYQNRWNYKRVSKTDEEWEELRMENLLKYKEEQKKKNKELVKKIAFQLKEEGQKPTIMKIKERVKLSKNTIAKYLKELKQEGII
ncbi:DNA-binding protein [Caminibacter pacificus]